MLAMPLEGLRQKYLDATDARDIIFYGYLYQEKKCFGLDYNDLIVFVLYLFEQNPDILLKWQKRLEYIMVDEFQDIDGLQHELMEVLAGYHKNLFVVGDPDQTIYTWRGADVRYLLDFDKRFPGTRTVMMLENYRSAPRVVAVANSLIEKNRERVPERLAAMRSVHGPTVWRHAKSPDDEARGSPRAPLRCTARAWRSATWRCSTAPITRRGPWKRRFCARRYRMRCTAACRSSAAARSRTRCRTCASSPTRTTSTSRAWRTRPSATWAPGAWRFCARRPTSWDAACSRRSSASWTTICSSARRRASCQLVDRFRSSYEGRPVSEVLAAVLSESGYERALRTEGSQERLDNLAELKQSVYEFETTCGEEVTLEHYLAHTALLTNADAMDDAQDKVRLMTVHAAKGLEFAHVFLCSVTEGVLPSRKTDTPQGMEEERRLAFVAMTRARDGLYLTEAEGRGHEGAPRYPSRFLLDIDPAALEFSNKPAERELDDARAAYALADRWIADLVRDARFAVGDRVTHAAFGSGRVLAVDSQKRAYEVAFDDLDTPRTISFKAKLEQA